MSSAGVLTVWLPNYSPWAKVARERAGAARGQGAAANQNHSASMWKNLDKRSRDN